MPLTLDTSTFSTIRQVCKETQRYSRMVSVIGDIGFGKSTALRYYANSHENVYYFNMEGAMTAKMFYGAILEVIGFKNIHPEKNSFNLIKSVVYYLKNTPGKHLLCITALMGQGFRSIAGQSFQ